MDKICHRNWPFSNAISVLGTQPIIQHHAFWSAAPARVLRGLCAQNHWARRSLPLFTRESSRPQFRVPWPQLNRTLGKNQENVTVFNKGLQRSWKQGSRERQRGPGWMRALPYAMAGPPVDVQFYVVTIDTTGFCPIRINSQWVFFSLVPSHPIKPFLLSSYSALKLLLTYENSMQRMEWADCHGDKNGMFILIYCMASRLLAASVFFAKQLDCLFENMTALALRCVFEPWWRLNR